MGERGPVPKRSEQRIRRNKDYPEITKAEAGGHFPAPFEPDEAWHPIALEFWGSLQHSGQARFYEQSDWVAAYILCEHLSRELKPQFIGFAKSFDASTGNSIETPLTMKVPLKGANLSAILYEPVIGGGILTPPVGYGKRLRSLADDCGALLIAEEVTTGMGRTGRWFGFEHDGIAPDTLAFLADGGDPASLALTLSHDAAPLVGAENHTRIEIGGLVRSNNLALTLGAPVSATLTSLTGLTSALFGDGFEDAP